VIEKDYNAVSLLPRTYFTVSGTEILKCKRKDIMICLASQAVYSLEVNSCILSLYLQSSKAQEMRRHMVFTHSVPSRLE